MVRALLGLYGVVTAQPPGSGSAQGVFGVFVSAPTHWCL